MEMQWNISVEFLSFYTFSYNSIDKFYRKYRQKHKFSIYSFIYLVLFIYLFVYLKEELETPKQVTSWFITQALSA